ncbi:hypothetical protein G9A89_019545 [Geosiphon pyriformis]|nr:hypothetical protein G9A89_019545 [Geosiphon pyriformis]
MDESGDEPNIEQSWASKVNSKMDSVSGILDLDNVENVIAEETCYVELDVSGLDDDMNDTMPRKMCTRTYVLNSKPPPLSFNVPSDGEDTLPLPSPKFYGSNCLSPIGSHASEKRNFNSSKSFALDIELSVVPGKTNNDKMISLKKNFYCINEFGRASTPSKFPRIIRSSFTSEISLNKARKLAISEKILVNDNLRKSSVHSNQEVIVKEIPVDLSKSAIEAVFSKFGKIISIKVQLIGLWQKALVEYKSSEMADLVAARWSVLMRKNFVYVAKTNIDKQMWVLRDQHRALLYTLPVGTNVYDLSSLLELYGGKTCYIGRNPSSYVRDRCTVICFGDEASKLAAIGTVSVFKNVSLHWTAGIYKKKSALVAHPVSFGGKTWAQVAGGSPSHMISSGLVGTGLYSGLVLSSMATVSPTVSHLNDWLVILERSLKLLTDHVSGILA